MKLPFYDSYCVDSSALIDLGKHYRRTIFPSLWGNLEGLIKDGKLIAPREVLRELEQKDDEISRWAKCNRSIFRDLDVEQVVFVQEMLKVFPNLVDTNKLIPDADPFIIALSRSEGCNVVTNERFSRPGERPRIPNVCSHYKVPCYSLTGFFEKVGWSF